MESRSLIGPGIDEHETINDCPCGQGKFADRWHEYTSFGNDLALVSMVSQGRNT